MLSSLKSSVLLLLLVSIATLLSLSAAMKIRHIHETTTKATAVEAETLLPITTTTSEPSTTTTSQLSTTTTPKPATTMKITTKMLLQSSAPSQQIVEDYEKSVKILFPTNNNSDEDSKFDVYGLKTTPPPKADKVKIEHKMATTEATIIATTKSSTDATNSVSNSTLKSIDDRLGILNLAPHCPDGQVIVNQHCHKSA